MKDSFIVKGVMALLLLSAVVLAGCSASSEKRTAHEHTAKQEYTCPMHPQIVREKPGKCPICGMDLVLKQTAGQETGIDSTIAHLAKPVNEQVVATTATIQPESSMRILSVPVQGSITYDTRNQTTISSRVSGRIERLLVKYNYQPVKKGQLIMEIYSPDLAAAQRELLFIYQQDRNNSLLQKAKLRLSLLGMQEGQINQVLRTGKVLYRVPVYSNASGYILEQPALVSSSTSRVVTTPTASNGGSDMNSMSGGGSSGNAMNNPSGTGTEIASTTSPVLIREGQYVGAGQTIFTIYGNTSLVAEFSFDPKMSSLIKRGQRLVFYKTSDPETVHTGTIGLIQPTFKAGSRFTVARVYLNDTRFQVGQLVTANVPITNKGWWVPQSAVLFLGNQSVVFKKEGAVFVPKPVQTRVTAESMVLIESGLSGNWEIAKNAAYMVDSESFIKLKSDAQKQSQ
jgi:membrane fusion protein, copper/silver efflux system